MGAPQFTPGPWHVGPMHRTVRPNPFGDQRNGDFIICDLPEHGKNTPDNARLIAAAPDLYQYLQNIVTLFERDIQRTAPAQLEEARAALAKARGEVA